MFVRDVCVLAALACYLTSGFPGVLARSKALWGQRIATCLMVLGGVLGLAGICLEFKNAGERELLRLPTPIPGADFVLATDGLSLYFLAPILLITMLGAVYGLEYWKQSEHPDGVKLRLFYGILAASLAVIVLAHNSITFLFGWEIMAVSAFFLVGTQDRDPEVSAAAWLYLAASHTATLALFVMFALMYGVTGSYDLVPLAEGSISAGVAAAIFIFALVGFGLKAGMMPLHFWLPSAHAMAPSHVSSVMSGVLIKSGIYGLVRITSLLPEPPIWYGQCVLVFGAVSAVLGVAFALGQHDLKRLLAYHSIENIGIILIGLGLALVGRSLHQHVWVVLGLAGCLLHVWNHALFKSLLFLSAGSVIHATHTREIDHLGGLAKTLPWTAGCFLLGAAAICGLPPLNGFVSEFLIYLGLFQTIGLQPGESFPAVAFLVPVMALMGALAVACFVKVFGVVFLGVRRTLTEHPAHESGWAMLGPMCILAVCCVMIGIAPFAIAPALDSALSVWTHQVTLAGETLSQTAPLRQISLTAIALIISIAAGAGLLAWRIRTQPLGWTETWGCGYTAPTSRMQYTASSLAEMLVSILSWPLQPQFHRPRILSFFPTAANFESHVPEVVLERGVIPAVKGIGKVLYTFRLVQQGSVQIYLLYMLAILCVLLLL